MSAPCYQCDKRCEGCHSTCPDYKDFTDNQRAAADRRRQYYDADGYARLKAQKLFKIRRSRK